MTNERDDLAIPDDAELWRRIPLRPGWLLFDENEKRLRPSSGAFKDNRNGSVSVFLAAESGGAETVLQGHDGFALVTLTVGLARRCGLAIVRDSEAGDPGHALLVGDKQRRVDIDGERLRVAEVLAKRCVWLGLAPPALEG